MKPLDRGDAVNLARNVVERDVGAALTPKGQMTLAQAVLAMDAELTRLYTAPEERHIPREQIKAVDFEVVGFFEKFGGEWREVSDRKATEPGSNAIFLYRECLPQEEQS